jgi:hypothetical protein
MLLLWHIVYECSSIVGGNIDGCTLWVTTIDKLEGDILEFGEFDS